MSTARARLRRQCRPDQAMMEAGLFRPAAITCPSWAVCDQNRNKNTASWMNPLRLRSHRRWRRPRAGAHEPAFPITTSARKSVLQTHFRCFVTRRRLVGELVDQSQGEAPEPRQVLGDVAILRPIRIFAERQSRLQKSEPPLKAGRRVDPGGSRLVQTTRSNKSRTVMDSRGN
jgi:hypothetical protein